MHQNGILLCVRVCMHARVFVCACLCVQVDVFACVNGYVCVCVCAFKWKSEGTFEYHSLGAFPQEVSQWPGTLLCRRGYLACKLSCLFVPSYLCWIIGECHCVRLVAWLGGT